MKRTRRNAKPDPVSYPPLEGALVSIRDACRKLTISRSTMWRLIASGAIGSPIQVSPGRKAFHPRTLEVYLEREL